MNLTRLSCLAGLTALLFSAGQHHAVANGTANFDANWLFLQSDITNGDEVVVADGNWRKLDLPHDWSIEGPFAATNRTGGAGAFLPGGVAWYRKHFALPADLSKSSIAIQFDGVMQNSDVWINGYHLGHRPSGYASFSYELTGHLKFGHDNVIAVRADTSAQPASRWYSGGGIYRHVRLVVMDPVHFLEHGVFITTPEATATEATAHLALSITNETHSSRDITVDTTLLAPDGQAAATLSINGTVHGHSNFEASPTIKFSTPQLWNLDDPKLYKAVTEIRSGDKLLDVQTNTFGIRDAHFEADTGFWFNGKNFKLQGVCLHADGGAFGAAIPLGVWQTRLEHLKSLGVNAIRTAHNPPAPEFLDLCDRLGFLVMDEMFDCWTVAKNPFDYHLYFNQWSLVDERDAILRDRNHPSIILYSVGNEIHDTPQAEKAKRILQGLVATAHAADPTRPVTQALFRPNVSHDYDDGLADLLDVVGQNYRPNEIIAAHEQKPSRKIVGTENVHDRNQWIPVRDNAAYSGEFLWTGIDYLGESRRWPLVGHGSGLLDRTGAIRPLARERQSWWSAAPMVAIARRLAATDSMPTDPGYAQEERHTQVLFSDWTPANLQPHTENVEVYSNCKQVELFLNGQSLGTKMINADAAPRNWQVPFAAGELKAVASDDGHAVLATDSLRTAGEPAKIVLTTDTKALSTNWDDVATVRAVVTDALGIPVPRANDLIEFKVSGPGLIAAVDNADNSSHESFQGEHRHAFQGACTVFVKATASPGKVEVTATAPGLAHGSLLLWTAP